MEITCYEIRLIKVYILMFILYNSFTVTLEEPDNIENASSADIDPQSAESSVSNTPGSDMY